MVRKLLTLALIFISQICFAQQYSVTGKLADATTAKAIADATITIEKTDFTTSSTTDGSFEITGNLPQGNQVLRIEKDGYLNLRLPLLLENEMLLPIGTIPMEVDVSQEQLQIGLISLSDNDLNGDDDQGDYAIAGLLSASNDAFINAAAFDFSATFFRPRGYGSENANLLINGVEMNKIFNGRPQWGNWGGLNDVQRNREFSMGLSPNDYQFGGLGGATNITMRASQYQAGGRISYAISNRTYTGRVMASYHSGLSQNGWAFSFSAARRYGKEGFVDGTLYDANSFFTSIEKKLNDHHSINLTAFYTPNRRGKSSANTQEVYDLRDIKYNSYWGEQNGEIRNSRIRKIQEPVIMLNHFWDVNETTRLNTNIAYQFGKIGDSRLGYDNAPNPDPSYYQKLPSYFLATEDPNYKSAYQAYENFTKDGQIDWQNIYATNIAYGGTSRYYLYEDRVDDKQISVNTIFTKNINDAIVFTASAKMNQLRSHAFANMVDLLGGNGYLDIDTFNQGDAAQSDLNNPNRILGEDDILKYNYEIDAQVYGGFAQAQFSYSKIDFYLAANVDQTSYQRNGLFRNGNYPESSFGESQKLNFTTYGGKGGATYKFTGRHLLDVNGAHFTDAPTVRNSFSNARQNNETVIGLTPESKTSFDASYIYRSPLVKARLTGYYTMINDATEVSFYYADGISGIGRDITTAFVQEVLTGLDKKHMGAELGIEAQITPTFKLKAAAAYGEFTYANNPDLYLTSDDFTEALDFGESHLKNYRIAGGPQQAYQLGFEYRDPDYWWVGVTTNYFSHAFLDVAPLTRTSNFYTDADDLPFTEYDEVQARDLLRQEQFDDYVLVNIVGGKSWRIEDKYVGFFTTVNNVLDQRYKTGGFEQGRSANYRTLLEDASNEKPVFGPKYWYGYGTTFYLNVYLRF